MLEFFEGLVVKSFVDEETIHPLDFLFLELLNCIGILAGQIGELVEVFLLGLGVGIFDSLLLDGVLLWDLKNLRFAKNMRVTSYILELSFFVFGSLNLIFLSALLCENLMNLIFWLNF